MSQLSDAIGLGVTVALVNRVSTTARTMAGDFESMESRMVGSAGRVKGALRDLKFGAGIAAAGAVALFALTRTVEAAAAYSSAIAEVSTLTDEATFKTEDMRRATLALNAQFGGGAAAQAKGLYQTISAGVLDASQATDLLGIANKLAVGGVTDVKTAIDGLTNVVNAYAESQITAKEAADSFFVATALGKTTPEELAGSIGLIAPTAVSVGVALDELNAAIAAITTKGIRTSEAVSGLRGAFAAILDPSKEARDEAKRLGIEFDAAALRTLGFKGFLDQLIQSGGANADSMAKLFGRIEAFNALQALAAGNAGVFNQALDMMAKKSGATDAAFEKMAATLEHQERRYQGLKENTILLIGRGLEPLMLWVTKIKTEIAEGFLAVPPGTRDFLVQLVAGAAAAAVLVGGLLFLKGVLALLPLVLLMVKGGLVSVLGSLLSALPVVLLLAGAAYILYRAFTDGGLAYQVLAGVILAGLGIWAAYRVVLGAVALWKGIVAAKTALLVMAQSGALLSTARFIGAMGLLALRMAAVAAWQGIVTAAQWAWNLAMSANPIGLIILGVAALIAAVALLVIYWDHVALAAMKAWRWMKSAVGADTTDIDLKIANLTAKIAEADKQREAKTAGENQAGTGAGGGAFGFAGAAGPTVAPPSTSLTPEARAQATAPTGAIPVVQAGAGERVIRLQSRTEVPIQIDGRELHRAVLEQEHELADRDGGG